MKCIPVINKWPTLSNNTSQIRLPRFISILTTRENKGTELEAPNPSHDQVLRSFSSVKFIGTEFQEKFVFAKSSFDPM